MAWMGKEIRSTVIANGRVFEAIADEDNLRQDVWEAGRAQNLDEQKLGKMAGEMSFDFISGSAPRAGRWVIKEKTLEIYPQAAYENLIEDGGLKRVIKVPKNMPEEYQERVLEEYLNRVWRHERQHVLQDVRSEWLDRWEFPLIKAAAYINMAIGEGTVVAAVWKMINSIARRKPVAIEEMETYFLIVCASYIALSVGLANYSEKWSFSEREADKYAKSGENKIALIKAREIL